MPELLDSALSVAAAAVTDVIDGGFRKNGVAVHVVIDTPAGARDRLKESSKAHLVNLFFYRVAPSGFHGAASTTEPLFLRVFCLITPFAGAEVTQMNRDEADLRLLGEVVRIFHEKPVLDRIPAGTAQPGVTAYRMQVTMLAPNMEEINHIWTTQGSDLAYKLSVAYEFSLVPLDPVRSADPKIPVSFAVADVVAGMEVPPPPTIPLQPQPSGNAVWGPSLAFVIAGSLGDELSVSPNTDEVKVRLSGPLTEPAVLTVLRMNRFGEEVGRREVVAQVKSADPLSNQAKVDVDISGGNDGATRVRITARAATPPSAPSCPPISVLLGAQP